MSKSETSNPNDGPSFQAPRYRPNWIAALLCFLFGAYLAVALVAYDPAQSSFRGTNPTAKNPVGWLGANTVWAQLYVELQAQQANTASIKVEARHIDTSIRLR